MPRVPAHLRERALGMLQGGLRTADVTRAINCNVYTVSNNVAYGHKPTIAGPDRTGKKCSSLTCQGFVSPGVMVGFAVIVEGMSVTLRPVLWSGIDLDVEGPSSSWAMCHSIIGLSMLSLQEISTLYVTGKTSSSLMWYPSCRLILT
uniref:Uncharacterized protein n=1 Tax=Oncorhynchus tshawytscha TaxID=74940 RepID=A0AAZ3Q112_ONCTS